MANEQSSTRPRRRCRASGESGARKAGRKGVGRWTDRNASLGHRVYDDDNIHDDGLYLGLPGCVLTGLHERVRLDELAVTASASRALEEPFATRWRWSSCA